MKPHVVVIGGGITGTLTARELALAGYPVTLLEGAHIGAGSSSRTAAGIRQQFSTPGTVAAMRYSVDFYRRFANETEDGKSPIIQNGYLFLHDDAERWAEAQQTVQVQQQAGLTEVEALSPAVVSERFAWVDADAIAGGTWCPSDGFLLPHLVYQEAARRCRELGVAVINQAMVRDARHADGRVTAVQTGKGWHEGDVFVDATNAWTARVGAILGGSALPVDPLKRYLWFLHRDQAMSANDLQAMPLTVAPTGAYCRPENADTLQFGKKYDVPANPDFTYDEQDTIDPAFTHNAGIDAIPYEVWMELAAVVPTLAEFTGVAATTSGFYGTTPDHNPFIDWDPAVPNLIRAVGFSGHGAMMGPFSAAAVTALVAAHASLPHIDVPQGRVPMDVFRIGRDLHHAETMVI